MIHYVLSIIKTDRKFEMHLRINLTSVLMDYNLRNRPLEKDS